MNNRVIAARSVPPPTDALAEAIQLAQLKVVDIGGRHGPIGAMGAMAPFADLFVCEPEPAAAETLRKEAQNSKWKSTTIFSEAIAESTQPVSLHVTRQPGLTSIYQPNADIVGQFFRPDNDWQVVSSVAVQGVPLDEAARKYGFLDAAFLKVDTQGSEHLILKSGRELVRQGVAVYVEMENLPFYREQPLFADVHQYLNQCGYTLFDLKRTGHRRQPETQLVYSKTELTWMHGLYFRTGANPVRDLSALDQHRLFALAVLLEYFDLAAQLLEGTTLRSHLEPHLKVKLLDFFLQKHAKRVFAAISKGTEEGDLAQLAAPSRQDRDLER